MPVPAGSGAPPVVTGPIYYDPVLSRVRLIIPGLNDLAPVQVQRSTDQVRWTTVRGGQSIRPVSGVARLDDYEFAADVPNFYRVLGPSVVDGFGRSASGGWSTADLGGAWTTTGGSASDFSVGSGVGRQSGGTVNVLRFSLLDVASTDFDLTVDVSLPITAAATSPVTLWLLGRMADTSNYYVARLNLLTSGVMTLEIARRVAGTITSVTSAVAAGLNTAGDVWRLTFAASSTRLVASARNLTAGSALVSTAGADASLTSGTQVGVASRLDAGNTNTLPVVALWDRFVAAVPTVDMFEGSIVPTIGGVWLKSVARPFLNQQVIVRDFSEVSRRARAGVFDVVGRSVPVAVTDVRGSRQWTLDVNTYTEQQRSDLDLLLASGDILLVQVPPNAGRISATPGGYVTVGDTREATPPTSDLAMRVFSLPCVEVAAPGPDVVGATSSWQTVLSTYATWADLLAANATWADLLELAGDPEDAVVS